MKKLAIITSAAAFALASGSANAVMLKNYDNDTVTVTVDSAGVKETIKLRPGESYDSAGKDATFTTGSYEPMMGKGAERYAVRSGKIEADKGDSADAARSGAPEAYNKTSPSSGPIKADIAPAAKDKINGGVAITTGDKPLNPPRSSDNTNMSGDMNK